MKYLFSFILIGCVYCSSPAKTDPSASATENQKSLIDTIKEKAESEEGQQMIKTLKEKAQDKEIQDKVKSLFQKKEKKPPVLPGG